MNDPSWYCPTYPSSLPTHIVPSHSRCHQLSKQIHNTINSLGDIPLANFDVRRHVEMTRVNVQPGEESVSGELWQWKVTWDLHSRVQSTSLLLLSGFFSHYKSGYDYTISCALCTLPVKRNRIFRQTQLFYNGSAKFSKEHITWYVVPCCRKDSDFDLKVVFAFHQVAPPCTHGHCNQANV